MTAQTIATQNSVDQAPQRTLAGEARLHGVGLHSGASVRLALRPADVGAGIRFWRADLGGAGVAALALNVRETALGTTLADPAGTAVATVEHLLAALSIAGIDNADIELDGPEAPILDGSAAPFLEAIEAAGVATQAAPRRWLKIAEEVRIEDGVRHVAASPGEGRLIDVTIDFDEPAIGRQRVRVDLDDPADALRLARARTFCRRRDIDAMRAAGRALGGSLDNAVVVDGAAILNDGGLRDPAEFALHKALDLVGDLALVGAPVIGLITGVRCGHDLNNRLARALAAAV